MSGDVLVRDKRKLPSYGEKMVCGLERLPNSVIQEIRSKRYYCVYAVGPVSGSPIKIGSTADIIKRFGELQSSTFEEMKLHYFVWTPGRPVARNLEVACHEVLTKAGKHIRGEWFDINAEWARRTIDTLAKRPNMITMAHDDVVRAAKASVMRKHGTLYFGVARNLPEW